MYEVLEPYGPLSRSTIWKRVADVYRGAGLGTWEDIPAVVTGNPLVGDLFAGALEAWVLDQGDAVDVGEPLYVIELGAGTGLFSHHFLNAVARRRVDGMFPHPDLVLVMCDQSDAQIDEWTKTPGLAPHVRAGALDFATFAVDDRAQTGALALKVSGRTLSALKNPVVVVANYFFDSIPTDAFRVRDGKVFEARTRFVRVRSQPGFDGLQNEEEVVEVGHHPYGEPALDGILGSYARDYTAASLLMPVAGIRCLQALMDAGGGRMLLLSIDKGTVGPGRIEGWFRQPFVAHGGVFSYLVNFDALRRFFEAKGGSALCSASDDRPLVCFVGTLPALASAGGHLKRFFADRIDAVDAFNAQVSLTQWIHTLPKVTEAAGVEALIDLLACMHADPDAFAMIMYRTVDAVAKADASVHRRARRLAALAKEGFLSPRLQNDVYYWSGRLHYALADFNVARQDFEASVAVFGKASHAHFFLGAFAEGRNDCAAAILEYTLHQAVQPECQATREALRRVNAKQRNELGAALQAQGARSGSKGIPG